MRSSSKFENIDVVVLCGGLGTRLREVVRDRPKAMAAIGNIPFLDILIDYISGFGFKRFILCVGHMKDTIKKHYFKYEGDAVLLFSDEKVLLGTAGALRNAEALLRSDPFLVVNGDTYCEIDLADFFAFHVANEALLSIALTSATRDADYGVVVLDDSRRIRSFSEKARPEINGLINAGMYFCNEEVLRYIPLSEKYSIENDLFPNILDKGVFGYVTAERLIDIGTPERYRIAEEYLAGRSPKRR